MTVEIEDRAGVKVVHVQGELVGGQGTLADAVVNLLDGYAITGAQALHGLSHGFHRSGAFMAHGERVLDHLAADSAGRVVMDVRAADTDDADSDQDIAGLGDGWRDAESDFEEYPWSSAWVSGGEKGYSFWRRVK